MHRGLPLRLPQHRLTTSITAHLADRVLPCVRLAASREFHDSVLELGRMPVEMVRATLRGEPRTMQEVLDLAVESYRRHLFLEETNAAFARLREDESTWGEVREERACWDHALADGLEDEPVPWPRRDDDRSEGGE